MMDYDHLMLGAFSQKAIIKGVDGRLTIHGARNEFPRFTNIAEDFSEIDEPAAATSRIKAGIYSLKGRGTCQALFSALYCPWAQKCLNQEQIIEFHQQIHNWMQGYRHALFLVKRSEFKPLSEEHPDDNLVVVHIVVNGYPQEQIYWSLLDDAMVIEGSNYNCRTQPYLVVPELY